MDFEVGAILAGKVTGITKYGAFVTVAPGKSGLVHISEIANTYVNDVREHLAVGQDVTVKVVGIDQTGRINLSIKAAAPPQPRESREPRRFAAPSAGKPLAPAQEPSFEDKLKRFIQDSDSKMSGLKQYSDKKGSRRRGK